MDNTHWAGCHTVHPECEPHADTAATRRYEVILVTRSYRTIVVEATDPDEAKELAINVEGNDPGTAWESEGDFDVYEVSLIDGQEEGR